MSSEPLPSDWWAEIETTEKRFAVGIPPCTTHSDCELPQEGEDRDLVAECALYTLQFTKDGSEFVTGIGCYIHP